MPKKIQVAIIGLGRFGGNVARTLFQSGHDVLGIDINEERVQEMQGRITYAVRGDATQQVVLNELGVKDYDAAAKFFSNFSLLRISNLFFRQCYPNNACV